MIPTMHIVAWSSQVPWIDQRQVEQDLIICRALVALFNDSFLKNELRFRGGTALNKLHFPKPLRYSEDIDLVRTTAGPIGPILDAIRAVLEPWLGHAAFAASQTAPKLRFRTQAEDGSGEIKLKVEINTWEIEAYDTPVVMPFSVESEWFSGQCDIATFTHEELLATKLRALLQRDKGRDLLDLSHALGVFTGLNIGKLIECFGHYLARANTPISRAEAESRMFAKLANPRFLGDIRPLLSVEEADKLTDEGVKQAFRMVFRTLISAIPGDEWARTPENLAQYEI